MISGGIEDSFRKGNVSKFLRKKTPKYSRLKKLKSGVPTPKFRGTPKNQKVEAPSP